MTLSEIHHCLCVLERGTIARGGTIVPQNSAFQLDMIISNLDLQDVRQTMSLTYYLVLGLDRRNLERSLEKIPLFTKHRGKLRPFFSGIHFVPWRGMYVEAPMSLAASGADAGDADEGSAASGADAAESHRAQRHDLQCSHFGMRAQLRPTVQLRIC